MLIITLRAILPSIARSSKYLQRAWRQSVSHLDCLTTLCCVSNPLILGKVSASGLSLLSIALMLHCYRLQSLSSKELCEALVAAAAVPPPRPSSSSPAPPPPPPPPSPLAVAAAQRLCSASDDGGGGGGTEDAQLAALTDDDVVTAVGVLSDVAVRGERVRHR